MSSWRCSSLRLARTEPAEYEVSINELPEGRWVLAVLEDKGRHIRTVAVPVWVNRNRHLDGGAGIAQGRLLHSAARTER